MSASIIDGKNLAGEREYFLKLGVEKLTKKIGRKPTLVAMELADDEGSRLYLKLKKAVAERVGIEFKVIKVSDTLCTKYLILKVKADGIFIQHPRGYDKQRWQELADQIPPEKDVDCLTSENLNLIKEGKPRFLPATVKAVLYCLEKYAIRNKRVVILGRSPILGLPLYHWLKNLGAKVTLLHSQSTVNDSRLAIHSADIVISAVGKPKIITGDMVKKGVIAIDCDSPVGDIDFGSVKQKASAITPVPGGVGPLTVVSLMENVLEAARASVIE